MERVKLLCVSNILYGVFSLILVADCMEVAKEQVDKAIEDEITNKLSEDLLQSIERKFQVDLERSVDMVLVKIKLLLQNGTMQIQDRLLELQNILDAMKKTSDAEVEVCLLEKHNETSALAEKALHQMVVCGYALIGHDPAQAVRNVLQLKNMIKQGLRPIHEQKKEVYNLLKVCGHDHETLKKVIKCVISKSPMIKSAMMDVTGKLIEGVVDLTKMMAHGAMHEACLIEVIKTVEDEAFELVKGVRNCVYVNETNIEEINAFIAENNATIIDVTRKEIYDNVKIDGSKKEVKEMKDLLRRMLSDGSQDLDKKFKKKLKKLQKDLSSFDTNSLSNDIAKDK